MPQHDEDGPLFRDAHRRADEVDQAATPGERRRAWARFAPSGLAALLEAMLRDSLVYGVVLFSVISAVITATSGDLPWAVGGVVCGLVGIGLVAIARLRRWSFGNQWLAIVVGLGLQVAVMVVFWQTH